MFSQFFDKIGERRSSQKPHTNTLRQHNHPSRNELIPSTSRTVFKNITNIKKSSVSPIRTVTPSPNSSHQKSRMQASENRSQYAEGRTQTLETQGTPNSKQNYCQTPTQNKQKPYGFFTSRGGKYKKKRKNVFSL
jgi:hypothetical protein